MICVWEKNADSRRGFTLIELLVTIAVVAVLASALLPALSNAKSQARRIHCVSNQRQIGVGFTLFADDHEGRYPEHSGWANYGGRMGTMGLYGAFTSAEERPLNPYVGAEESFRCAADGGDAYSEASAEHCYEGYGTSYLGMWATDYFGVQKVTDRVGGDPIKVAEIGLSPANKLILGDWNWPVNRSQVEQRSRWHNFRGEARHNVLWGDTHVDYWRIPSEWNERRFESMDPDPSFLWW